MERTLTIIKPDAVRKNLIGEVLQRIEMDGLSIAALKMVHLSTDEAAAFYKEHKGKPFFDGLIEFITSGPIVPGVIAGDNAISRLRTIMGDTDPAEAAPGTIRAEFAEGMPNNIIHGSDSTESAKRERAFFFEEDEMFRG